jgi:tRNA dimethylallyltransferase
MRPTRARVRHHLIDIRDPAESYSAGEFVRDAAACHAGDLGAGPPAAARRGHDAVLPRADARHRGAAGGGRRGARWIDAQAAKRGLGGRAPGTRAVDPQAAARIHVNDPQRIQRALEVYRLTGRPSPACSGTAPRLDAACVVEFALAPAERRRCTRASPRASRP